MSASHEGVRLQKVMAAAGIASRRASEAMIEEGRVEVNGRLVTGQGLRVDPERDVIRVDGSRLPPPKKHAYVLLNKPRGVLSTMEDPQGRPTLLEYLPPVKGRLFHVGRLDADTEGLIILTNDGDFAQRLAHPSFEVPKTYLAEVAGRIKNQSLNKLESGVLLDDGPARADAVSLKDRTTTRSLLTITLHEGRNRIVRRMMDAVGHPVKRLARVSIGPVKLGNLPVGQTRELSRKELGELLDTLGL